jgi:hypothetical protein
MSHLFASTIIWIKSKNKKKSMKNIMKIVPEIILRMVAKWEVHNSNHVHLFSRISNSTKPIFTLFY